MLVVPACMQAGCGYRPLHGIRNLPCHCSAGVEQLRTCMVCLKSLYASGYAYRASGASSRRAQAAQQPAATL